MTITRFLPRQSKAFRYHCTQPFQSLLGIKNVKRCVDDSILYEKSIEENFWATCRYLTVCGRAGIIMTIEKLIFCQKELEYVGFALLEDGLKPSKDLLQSITDFPRPSDISGIRSWFGLVEQCAWAFSKTSIMEPFRHLLSPKSEFKWSQELQDAFDLSKAEIVRAASEGVKTFDPARHTCISTDWSKTGLGFCLLQKWCQCLEITPICCPTGWRLVICNSRFTTPAEQGYSPVEGEALAVVWSLKKAKHFVLGCQKLTIATDHNPLLGLFKNRNLEDIENTRLSKLKVKTFNYRFNMVHVPGIKNKVADATSRYPTKRVDELSIAALQESGEVLRLTQELLRRSKREPTIEEILECEELEASITAGCKASLASLQSITGVVCSISTGVVSWEKLQEVSSVDKEIQTLVKILRDGVEDDRNLWPPMLTDYLGQGSIWKLLGWL